MKVNAAGRVLELEEKIAKASNEYYNGVPTISDEEFDALKDELKDLSPLSAQASAVGAPISGNSNWDKLEHQIPMGSQDKINNIKDLSDWLAGRKLNVNHELCVQEKLDGISISLNYAEGLLESAVTRGNGTIGENIFKNVLKMKGVRPSLAEKFTGSIRGEIVLLKSDWQKYMPELANPRNAASGIARKTTSGGQEHLTVMCYDLVSDNLEFDFEIQKINKIKILGLMTPNCIVCAASGVEEIYKDYESIARSKLDYEIDGLVLKLNNIQGQLSLGNAGNDSTGNPRGQVALKFSHEMRESIVNKISWQIGLTGRVTPVAEFKPVKIAGVNVSKASLHNVSNLRKLGVRVGSRILVSRRNDVIPFVERVLEGQAKDVVIPKFCPDCENPLKESGEYIICENESCGIAGSIEKWINVTEIENIGPSVVSTLVNALLVSKPGDLYKLSAKQLEALDRMGQRSAEKIVKCISAKKELPLHLFLAGLNIPNCGRRVFKNIISSGYDSLEKIQSLSVEQVKSIQGLGESVATAVVLGLKKKEDVIKDLLDSGVSAVAQVAANSVLDGKSFCFSGAMTMPRSDLEKLVANNGGQVKSVSKELTFLVVADPNEVTSKITKAKKLGVNIISEQDFLRQIQ